MDVQHDKSFGVLCKAFIIEKNVFPYLWNITMASLALFANVRNLPL